MWGQGAFRSSGAWLREGPSLLRGKGSWRLGGPGHTATQESQGFGRFPETTTPSSSQAPLPSVVEPPNVISHMSGLPLREVDQQTEAVAVTQPPSRRSRSFPASTPIQMPPQHSGPPATCLSLRPRRLWELSVWCAGPSLGLLPIQSSGKQSSPRAPLSLQVSDPRPGRLRTFWASHHWKPLPGPSHWPCPQEQAHLTLGPPFSVKSGS